MGTMMTTTPVRFNEAVSTKLLGRAVSKLPTLSPLHPIPTRRSRYTPNILTRYVRLVRTSTPPSPKGKAPDKITPSRNYGAPFFVDIYYCSSRTQNPNHNLPQLEANQ